MVFCINKKFYVDSYIIIINININIIEFLYNKYLYMYKQEIEMCCIYKYVYI